jgi:hypothetical protein
MNPSKQSAQSARKIPLSAPAPAATMGRRPFAVLCLPLPTKLLATGGSIVLFAECRMKTTLKLIIAAIVTICLLWIAFRVLIAIQIGRGIQEAKRPRVGVEHYEEVVSARKSWSDRYSFLPAKISPNAKAAAFHHIPGFLQGGDTVCIRLLLPQEEVSLLLDALEKSGRTEIESFAPTSPPKTYLRFGVSEPSTKDVYQGSGYLPNDFRIFLFASDLEDIHENGNHNFLAFTAVSARRSEVVYFVDNW